MIKRILGILLLSTAIVFNVYAQDATSDNGHAWVGDGEVNVRETPSTRGNALGVLAPGTELIIHGRENTEGNGLWVFVTPVSGGVTGWVLSDFLLFPLTLDLTALPIVSNATTSAAPTPAPVSVSIP